MRDFCFDKEKQPKSLLMQLNWENNGENNLWVLQKTTQLCPCRRLCLSTRKLCWPFVSQHPSCGLWLVLWLQAETLFVIGWFALWSLQASHETDEPQWSHGLTALTSAGADHVADPSQANFKPLCFSFAPQIGIKILGKILEPYKMQS